MKKAVKVLFGGILLLCLLLGQMPALSQAADTKELRLICEEGYTKVENMLWRLFRIGESRDGQFVLTGQFAGYPVDMKHLTEKNVGAAAMALESFAVGDEIPEADRGYTDKNGTVSFKNLEPGLYLVIPSEVSVDIDTYYSSPVIVEMTADDDRSILPKVYVTGSLSGSGRQFTVKKVWKDTDKTASVRPVSVTVDLYKNGTKDRTVTLDAGSKWEYTWETEDTKEVWRVVERDIPAGYTVLIEYNTTQYLIENTFGDGDDLIVTDTNTETTVTTIAETTASTAEATVTTAAQTDEGGDTTTVTDLPQTGQPWVPVYGLAGGGIVLILAGLLLKGRANRDEE